MPLVVTAPQDQDIVRMEITAEPDSVYPMQPFTVILSISVKELPEPNSNVNPISVQTSPPELQIPWVDDEQLARWFETERRIGALACAFAEQKRRRIRRERHRQQFGLFLF